MNDTLRRIETVLDMYGSTKTTLARKIGLAQSTLSSIFIRDMKPNQTLITSILSIYQDVRQEWLVNGEEPMLKSQMKNQSIDQLLDIVSNLSATVKAQQETINKLQTIKQ